LGANITGIGNPGTRVHTSTANLGHPPTVFDSDDHVIVRVGNSRTDNVNPVTSINS